MRTSIHVTTKDRATEVSLLLTSLRSQTYQDWDIIILDDGSGTPLGQFSFFISLTSQLKLEGHKVKVLRNDQSQGVCNARNFLIESDDFDNPLTCRLDDDIVLKEDYLARLVDVVEAGYGIATGVVPLLGVPELVRESERVGEIVCRHELDKEGSLVLRNDELAYCYDLAQVLPCDQFRTNALYKSEIHKVARYPDCLTPVGFREELWFSFKALIAGYTIGADLGAKCWHLRTPSGGVRRDNYRECVLQDEETTNRWVKEMYLKHGNFLEKNHKRGEVA